MTILQVRHRTTYRYTHPVSFGDHRMMFRPRDSHDQRLLESSFEVSPTPRETHWIHDVFGNSITIVAFDTKSEELRFESRIVLDHTPEGGPQTLIEGFARHWPFTYDETTLPDLAPVMRVHYPDPAVETFAHRFLSPSGKTETGHLLMSLTAGIRDSLKYSRRTDPGTQAPALTLERGTGTCRDYALLMMECVRALGFAARFVSGYIYSPARGRDPHLGGGATHAWVQVFLPGAGWMEFDPTNGIVGNTDLIRVGVARDPKQARPLSGSFGGTKADYLGMEVQVNVTAADQLRTAAE